MKAPISKKTLEILSDKIGSRKLIQSVIVGDNHVSDNQIEIGSKKYELHRVPSYQKN